MVNKQFQQRGGFSLIEIMVSLAVFSIVVLVAAGALLSIIDGAKKTQALKSVINNLNFALEDMSRNLRVSTAYYCGEGTSSIQGGATSMPTSCPNGTSNIAITFKTNKTKNVAGQIQPIYSEYKYFPDPDDSSVGYIAVKDDIDFGSFIRITAPEVKLTKVSFQVIGAEPPSGNLSQPRILMTIQGYAGINLRSKSYFNVQTTITQRTLDF